MYKLTPSKCKQITSYKRALYKTDTTFKGKKHQDGSLQTKNIYHLQKLLDSEK